MKMQRSLRSFLAVFLTTVVLLSSSLETLAKTTVAEKDCVITITINIQISGAGASDAVATRIKNEIESCYNGKDFKYDCCKVKFVAKVTNGGPNDPNAHQVEIIDDPSGDYIDNVDLPMPTPNGGSGSGTWGNNSPAGTYAHEAGHLMGLDDKYKVVTRDPYVTKPCDGHNGDKMAELDGTPQQAAINEVVEAAGVTCPDKCKKGKASSSDSGKKTADVNLPKTGETVYVAVSPQANFQTTVQMPPALGGGEVLVGPFDGSLTLMIDGPADSELNPLAEGSRGSMELLEFDFIGPPIELPSGTATGEVILSLNTSQPTHRSLGYVDTETGLFRLYINGNIKTEAFGNTFEFPFESIITGHFNEEAKLAEFQCETLITIVPESDIPDSDVPDGEEPLRDCDHDGMNDAQQIESGLALDLNRDAIPDVCQASRALRFYNGESTGGSIEAKIGGFNHACKIEVPTYAGESCDLVMDRFALMVNEDPCLQSQGISATTENGRLSVEGLGVYLEEDIQDSGIERLRFGVPLVVGSGN